MRSLLTRAPSQFLLVPYGTLAAAPSRLEQPKTSSRKAVTSKIDMATQSVGTKLQLGERIRTQDCRAVLGDNPHKAAIFTFIGKEGPAQYARLLMTYLDNDASAPLAPLLATEKNRILACYADPLERASLKSSIEQITVVEPSTEAAATPEVEERIAVLEAVKETTKLPQLQGLSSTIWKKRLPALCTSAEADAEIGGPVPDGFKFSQHLRESRTEPWCKAAARSIDVVLRKLRDLRLPPSAEALKKMKRDAFGDAYKKLMEVVGAAEDKAIHAMPSEGPALTEALTKRFAPRAEAAAQRDRDRAQKAGSAYATTYKEQKEQGKKTSLDAANKETDRCIFGLCKTPKGDVSAPNNNYPQYVFKRIEHGIAKAANITSWMKYEVSKKKKKNKKRRK